MIESSEKALFAYHKNRELIIRYALVGLLLAFITMPFPGTSLILLGLEVIMIVNIIMTYGKNIHFEIFKLFFSVILVPLVVIVKIIAVEVFGWIPVIGWIIKLCIAFGFIWSLGSIVNYLLKPTSVEMKQLELGPTTDADGP